LDTPQQDGSGPPGPRSGSEQGLSESTALLYSELRRLASYYLRRERGNHTLQATALVHEAYLRLVDQRDIQWGNRNQVMGIAAQLMRRILLDYSRSHQSAKRGGNVEKVYLQEAAIVSTARAADVVALDEALIRLAETRSPASSVGGVAILRWPEYRGDSRRPRSFASYRET